MTSMTTMTPSAGPAGGASRSEGLAGEQRRRVRSWGRGDAAELTMSALSAGTMVWLGFRVLNIVGTLGFVLCWYATFLAMYGVVARERHGRLLAGDRVATVLVVSAGIVALMPLVAIIVFVVGKGAQVLSPHFFTQTTARVGPSDPPGKGGIAHAIVGSIEQVGIATVVSIPIAIMTAVYLNEIGGRLSRLVRFIVDAMSGTPSIIAGLFIFVVWVIGARGGYSGTKASAAIAILMIPYVTRTAEEVLRIVPGGLRESALALGSPEWRMVTRVVLPTARTGIITATILGLARAVGETAPLLLTAFGANGMNVNPAKAPQESLPLFVYTNIQGYLKGPVARAWGAALVLVFLVLVLFTLARIVGSARKVGGR